MRDQQGCLDLAALGAGILIRDDDAAGVVLGEERSAMSYWSSASYLAELQSRGDI